MASGQGRRRKTMGVLTGIPMCLILLTSVALAAPRGQLWVARYDGPASNLDEALSLAVSPDGTRVFVTGDSAANPTGPDITTIAYDILTGDQLWLARYGGPTGDAGLSITVSPNGTAVFVTGYTTRTSTRLNYTTVAYSASTGQQLWAATYDGASQDDYAFSIGVDPTGSRVFVTGWSWANYGFDYATVAYDASTGQQLWVARYHDPDGTEAYSLGVSPDGSRVFVTGHHVTIAYDASTGQQAWLADNGAIGLDYAKWVESSPDGSRVFVTGFGDVPGSGDDYLTVAFDASNGQELWKADYNGTGNDRDWAYALGVSPNGARVFVTGTSYGSTTSYDYATVAYDASTGVQAWARRYNGPGNALDEALSLAVSPDGAKVFVTGDSKGSGTNADYATIGYVASTGAKRLTARYDDPSNGSDLAYSVRVSPDGTKVFVTGASEPNRFDYATIAYGIP